MIPDSKKNPANLSYSLGWAIGKLSARVNSMMEWLEPKIPMRKLISRTATLVDYAGESTFKNIITRDGVPCVTFVCSEKCIVGDRVQVLLKEEYKTDKEVEVDEVKHEGVVGRIQIQNKPSQYLVEVCLRICETEDILD